VAGFFHDHIFVPWGRASDALTTVRSLQPAAGDGDGGR
jgi:uncharacterized protein